MRRREVIKLLSGASASMAWPLSVRTQQSRPTRIGYLSPTSSPDPNIDTFRRGMQSFGYSEDRNLVIEVRYAGRDYNRFPALVRNW
jgi:hypothetical protein